MRNIIIFTFLLLSVHLFAQNVTVNGYVFESGNRGYLNQVDIEIVDPLTGTVVKEALTNGEGYFEVELPANKSYVAYAQNLLSKSSMEQINEKLCEIFYSDGACNDKHEIFNILKKDKKNKRNQPLAALITEVGSAKYNIPISEEEVFDAFKYYQNLHS